MPSPSRARATEKRVSVFGVGVQKGGSSALHRYLRRHPGMSMPITKKELHFFDRAHFFPQERSPGIQRVFPTSWKGWVIQPGDEQRRFWSSAQALDWYHANFATDDGDRVRAEVTPRYCFERAFLERIHAYNPQAKLILSLRDPIERAKSHYLMKRRRGHEDRSFSAAIRPRRPGGPLSGYVARSLYARQVRDMLDIFPRENLLFLQFERFVEDGQGVLDRIFDFVGVARAAYKPPKLARTRASSMELSSDDEAYLNEIYEPEVRELENLLNWKLEDWLPVAGRSSRKTVA